MARRQARSTDRTPWGRWLIRTSILALVVGVLGVVLIYAAGHIYANYAAGTLDSVGAPPQANRNEPFGDAALTRQIATYTLLGSSGLFFLNALGDRVTSPRRRRRR